MKIIGQNVTDNTRQEIANALRKIEPAIDVEVEYIELPNKPDYYVIAIYFDSNSFKNGPYSFDGRPFYKVESTTALMPRQMYEERLKLSNPHRFSWENTPNAEISIKDIDTELLYQTLHDGIGSRRIHASAMTLQDPKKIMQKLGVAKKDGTILNAANVLFGKEPTTLHTQCKVRLAIFEGTDKRVFRDQTICEGNLFEQYDAVMDFCLKHLNLAGRMDSKFRQDTLTVPYEAVREATINMLCHRSWDAENTTPSLAIYDNRMVFQNPGTFPTGTSWQDFADNQIGSLPANPTIANVFYRRGAMEAWGRGLGLIVECCKEQGLPEPEFKVVSHFVNLTIWFKQQLKDKTGGESQPAPQLLVTTTPSDTPSHQVAHPKPTPKSPQEKVFDFCHTPKSITEIANMLGVKDKKWVRKKYVAPFLGLKLQMTIPDKPNSQNQKYQTLN